MKLTPEYLESLIHEETYTRPGAGTLTICVLTLAGGCHVTGESNVIDPSSFDADIGKEMARKDAVSRIWQLEGYHVKRQSGELLIRAARAGHSSIAPGWNEMDPQSQNNWINCARHALSMQPDDDIPSAITDATLNAAAAARFCVVARAVFGI